VVYCTDPIDHFFPYLVVFVSQDSLQAVINPVCQHSGEIPRPPSPVHTFLSYLHQRAALQEQKV
jgi:hypothetical protein